MGTMTPVRPPAALRTPPARPPLVVTALVVGWILLAGLGGLRALLVLTGSVYSPGGAETDTLARAAKAAPDLVTDEMREALARRDRLSSLERGVAVPMLVLASFGIVGAVALGKRRTWSRPLLWWVGALVISLLVFHAVRLTDLATAPAAGLAMTDPDARGVVALYRAGIGLTVALQAIPLAFGMGFLRHADVRDWVGGPEGWRTGPLLVATAGTLLVAAGASFLTRSRPGAPPVEKASGPSSPEPLPETFRWHGQPIAFRPPAGGWTRERHAEGGRTGVSFTRYEAPPSRLTVAEASFDPQPRTVEEVLPRLRLTTERFKSVESVTVGDPVPAVVAGFPAFQTDYALRERSMQHRGREFLTVVNGHVFVLTFLGRETDLPVFENLVASVRFPDAARFGGGVATATEQASPGDAGQGRGTELRVGEQRLTLRMPASWEHVDYGERQEFRQGEVRIALVDAGTLDPDTSGDLDDERLIGRALRLFGHDPRRWEVSSKTRIRTGSGEALVIDTWDPMSHVPHQRVVLFVNGGRLLVAGASAGSFEATKGPLEGLARSVRFPG